MKVLFVCTGNSCRSPMAKEYFQKRISELGRKDVEVACSGVAQIASGPATEYAKEVMRGEGLDLSNHKSRPITDQELKESDLIFVMENRQRLYLIARYPKAASKIYLLKEFKKIGEVTFSNEPDIPDPIGKDLDFYKKVFSFIKESIERVLREI